MLDASWRYWMAVRVGDGDVLFDSMKPVDFASPSIAQMSITSTFAETTSTFATWAIALARSISIGLSGSCYASTFANRLFRKSVILFFTGRLADCSLEPA